MNNVFIYCETEDGTVVDVSLELLTKGRKLADELQCELEAVAIGSGLKGIEKQILPYGVDTLYLADDKRLYPYLTLPHASIVTKLFEETKPQVALFGATAIGRDITPRIASALRCGLTADCTGLVIGDHEDKRKGGKTYKNLLLQIRPAFGGNILATIVNPDTRPQIATVREGVMKKDILSKTYKGAIKNLDAGKYLNESDFVVKIISRNIEKQKINIKNASIIVAGGFGVGSKENFQLLYELADLLGGDVAGSRPAVDAGFIERERQVGQTGITVRPKLYIACGISGAIQHVAGMKEAAMVISINNNEHAPINAIADYRIIGDVSEVIPRIIKMYKKNSK